MTSTLLHGGRIYSPGQPQASAMLVVDERVTWVGDDSGASSHRDAADRVEDLDGALVTPAFVDAHVHLSQTGLALDGVDLSGATNRTHMLDLLAAHAARHDDTVILGFSWDDSRWDQPGAPTSAEIDRAVGDRPAYASRVDGHSAVLSSALAVRAPRLVDAKGWDGTGRVERDAHHIARDAAQALIGEGQRRAALRRALDHAASLGLGCVHEISAPHINPPSDLATIRELAAEAPTITVIPYWGELHAVERARELGCVGAAGDLCMDGSFGSRTAALTSPYADADTAGHLYVSADEARAHVVACTRAGIEAGFHAIGDAGVTAAVEGFAAAAAELGLTTLADRRHRLEHVEMVTREQAVTLARLGVRASVQPAFDAAWGGEDGMYVERLGRDRALAMNPYATLARTGVELMFGSDSPVTPLDPWGGVRAAARHHTPEQRLSSSQAFQAHVQGHLAAGAAASYSVWATTDLDSAVDATPSCLRTVVDGVVVFNHIGAPQ